VAIAESEALRLACRSRGVEQRSRGIGRGVGKGGFSIREKAQPTRRLLRVRIQNMYLDRLVQLGECRGMRSSRERDASAAVPQNAERAAPTRQIVDRGGKTPGDGDCQARHDPVGTIRRKDRYRFAW